jgi:hypothetical protein
VHEHVRRGRVGRRRERGDRLGVAVDDARAIHQKRGDARRRAVAGPRRERRVRAVGLHRRDEPEEVRRAGRESGGESRDVLAQGRAVRGDLHGEGAQRPGPLHHRRASAGGGEAERAAGLGREGERRAVEAERAQEGTSRGAESARRGGRRRRGAWARATVAARPTPPGPRGAPAARYDASAPTV